MKVPFTKAHGASNDFLLTWAHAAPRDSQRDVARAMCYRHTGIGADGWILVSPGPGDAHASIRLYNSDGSDSEISGNGTRCAAAFLADAGLAEDKVRILTGAGLRHLRLLERDGLLFRFEMNMGRAVFPHQGFTTLDLAAGPQGVLIVDVGNPQCVVMVDHLEFDWHGRGAEIERHPRFPQRTNVSFVQVVDEHTLDVRFFERGAGETMSSGTGSTGAVAAALRLGRVRSPVTVLTLAGPLDLRLEQDEIYLTGPAQIVGGGEFYL